MILRLSKKRKNFYPIFALIIFVSFALYLPVFAVGQGEISVETNLDKSIITIGDRVHYTLLVTHSPDVLVEMPATGVNLGQFEIQDYQISEPEEIDDMIVESVTYRISVYEVGKFLIPPVMVRYSLPPDSTVHEMQSEESAIQVESVKPSEAEDIQDIKAPMMVPPDYSLYYWLGLLACLFLAIVVAIYIYMKKFRKIDAPPLFAPPPPRPSHEIAYQALNELERSDLLESGEIKAFYIEISLIIRSYLGGRYEIDTLEMTTEELFRALDKAYDIEESHVDMIRKFSDGCDLVKFAKLIPQDKVNKGMIPNARQIIDETKRTFINMTAVHERKPHALTETETEASG